MSAGLNFKQIHNMVYNCGSEPIGGEDQSLFLAFRHGGSSGKLGMITGNAER